MSFPFVPPPYPPRPTGHHATCPDPGRHQGARAAAIIATVVTGILAAVYTLRFHSTDGIAADRTLTWMLARPTWVIGAATIASIASLRLPARLHHAPLRWIALSLAIGIAAVLAALTAEFGGYLLLGLLMASH
ncbi:hypothetical protein SAMN05216223_12971 [Actinacidiphila yanglinensis]|uniref:Uncharacterized protein n=1 Tax=Actinacidiphila yanglinensis TaxID=310779 RepID=A0A1H6E8W1_9ACTN|nr:hypothetical protein [Actinacidiphila yanglinensis]SEG94190.1 hypothetical protein SAMN05216223_12971 [Actinacidiphila yanglinensis]